MTRSSQWLCRKERLSFQEGAWQLLSIHCCAPAQGSLPGRCCGPGGRSGPAAVPCRLVAHQVCGHVGWFGGGFSLAGVPRLPLYSISAFIEWEEESGDVVLGCERVFVEREQSVGQQNLLWSKKQVNT